MPVIGGFAAGCAGAAGADLGTSHLCQQASANEGSSRYVSRPLLTSLHPRQSPQEGLAAHVGTAKYPSLSRFSGVMPLPSIGSAHPGSSPALLSAASAPCAAAVALGLAEYAELLSSLEPVLARGKKSLFSEDAAADT